MTNGEATNKGALKSLFRSLEKRNKSQPYQDPLKGEGQLGTFLKETLKIWDKTYFRPYIFTRFSL